MKTLIFNWKMNPETAVEAVKIFKAENLFLGDKKIKIMSAPPFVYLEKLSKIKAKVELAGQNLFFEERGAFTGEISAKMLKNLNVKTVIIGHSERRALGETDGMINKKIKMALKEGLKVVVCVGEKKEGKASENFILNQIKKAFDEIDLKKEKRKILIAYEPIFAIGTGKSAMPEYVSKIVGVIKKEVKENIPVLYGGSVNGKNIESFLREKNIDGALVGGASLKIEETKEIIEKVK